MNHEQALAFVHRVANILYDGRECSHEDGCHDHYTCQLGCDRDARPWDCACVLGECCGPVDMDTDDEHDALVMLATEARELLEAQP